MNPDFLSGIVIGILLGLFIAGLSDYFNYNR